MSDNGWIEVVRRYRLWDSVPAEERVTEQDIRDHGGNTLTYLEEELERLANPRCVVALQHSRYNGKWSPCNLPVKPGVDRCKTHGGPTTRKAPSPRPTRVQLEAELVRLRARLAVEESE